jgi:hypothetical protein
MVKPHFARVGTWMAAFAALVGVGTLLWSKIDHPSAGRRERVIAVSTLGQHDPILRSAAGFERIRIPATATDIQLSLPIAQSTRDERFAAEIVAVDGGLMTKRTVVDATVSAGSAMVHVTTAVPYDGDYLLRLRRVTDGDDEVVFTTGFRVVRVAGGTPETR